MRTQHSVPQLKVGVVGALDPEAFDAPVGSAVSDGLCTRWDFGAA